MSAISIRPSTEGDIPAITAIYAHAVTNGTASYELAPPDEAEMAARRLALVSAGYPHLAAEDEAGRMVGYAYASAFRPRPAYRFTVEDSVYVAAERHGRGIGRALLVELLGRCRQLGFRQMVAVIGDGSRHSASVKLHEALGFVLAGTLGGTGYKHDLWLDTVFMQLALNEGDAGPPDPESLPERNFRGRA